MAEKDRGESTEANWQQVNRRALRGKQIVRTVIGVMVLVFALLMIAAVIAQPDLAGSAYQDTGSVIFLCIFVFLLGRSVRKHRLLANKLPDTAPTATSAKQALLMASQIKDKRRPVLYLRSFGTDPELAQLASAIVRGSWRMRTFVAPRTEEEQLLEAFSLVGPVVAVGDPSDRVGLFGAYRIYISDDVWQEAVTGLIDRSAVVVIGLGGSPASGGLLWEIAQARQRLKPSALFILFLHASSFDAFVTGVSGLFTGLPASLPGTPMALAFTGDWEPRLIPLFRKSSRPIHPVRQVNAMIAALAPAFDRTGTQWRRYRRRRSMNPSRMAPVGPSGASYRPSKTG